jgi:hypothetical protein
VNPRREPLLWLQLLGVAAMPAELLAVALLLAGADPGPVPAIERLLLWALGALLPSVLLWRRPVDVWSLLLVQTPLRGRRDGQRRLSALSPPLPLRLLGTLAAWLLLPGVWRLDALSAQFVDVAPLADISRLMALLLAMPLLAVVIWQWHQAIQATWLLTRSPEQVAASPALPAEATAEQRLSLGLPLLLPDPLCLQDTKPLAATTDPPKTGHPPAGQPLDGDDAAAGQTSTVTPEQDAETGERPDLDEQVG